MRGLRPEAFTFLVALLALAAPASAQDWKGQGRLEGKVLDAEGQPVEGALVRLELPRRGVTELKTDKKGKWAILGLAGGTWTLDIAARGFETRNIQIPVREASSNRPVEIKLNRSGPVGPPPEILQAILAGDEAYQAGNFLAARLQYEGAIEKYAALADAQQEALVNLHIQIARCYNQEKNYTRELEHLQFVLNTDPTNLDIRKLMAMEALQAGLFDRGAELLGGIEEGALDNPDVLFNIAVAFYNGGKTNETIAYLTKAVTLNPAYADGYFFRASAYLNQQKMEEAKADYRRFLDVVAADDSRIAAVRKALDQLK